MSWRLVQNSNDIKPDEIDTTSSKSVVYIRKDFKEVEISGMEEGETRTVWQYLEQEIPQQDWELYRSVLQNETDISDLTDAVIELAGLIGGE